MKITEQSVIFLFIALIQKNMFVFEQITFILSKQMI